MTRGPCRPVRCIPSLIAAMANGCLYFSRRLSFGLQAYSYPVEPVKFLGLGHDAQVVTGLGCCTAAHTHDDAVAACGTVKEDFGSHRFDHLDDCR